MDAHTETTLPVGSMDEPDRDGLERGILWVLASYAALMGLIGFLGQPILLVLRYTLAGSTLRADAVVADAVVAGGESLDVVRDDLLVGLWFLLGLWILLAFLLALMLRFNTSLRFVGRGFQTPWGRGLGPTLAMGAGIAGLLGVIGTIAMLGYLLAEGDPDAASAIAPTLGAATLWPAYALAFAAGLYLVVAGGLWLFRVSTAMPEPDRTFAPPSDADGFEQLVEPPRQVGSRAVAPRLGICSSGGGLRSASFNLGAYQVLSARGEFQKASYLSAVSGGAYMAGGMTAVDGNLSRGERALAGPFAPGSPEERHLRRNSYYLAPTFPAKLAMFGRLLLGLAFSIVLIGAVLTATARPWGAFMASPILYPEMNGRVDAVAVAAGEIESAAASVATQASEQPVSSVTRFAGEAEEMRNGAVELLAAHDAWEETFEQASAVASVLVVHYNETDDSANLARVVRRSGELTLLDAETRRVAAEANELALEIRELGANAGPEETARIGVAAAVVGDHARGLADFAGRLSKPSLPVPGGWEAIAVSLAIALVVGMMSIGSQVVNDREGWRRSLQRTSVLVLAVAVGLFLTLVAVPWLLTQGTDWVLKQGTVLFAAIQSIGAAFLAIGAVRTILAKRASILGTIAGGIVAPLMIILATLAIARAGAEAGDPLGGWTWVLGAVLILVAASVLVDLNAWSMHPFYRRKLASAFLRDRSGDRTEPLSPDQRRLSHYRYPRTYHPESPDLYEPPELIIGAAANITEVGATPSGRNAISFTFSPYALRAERLGWVPTIEAEEMLGSRTAGTVTLPSAVAISGAAVSPAMGKMTRRPLQALLALANVRLGVWMPNPAWMRAFLDHRDETLERLHDDIRAYDERITASEQPRYAPGRMYDEGRRYQADQQRRRAAQRRWKDRVRPTYLVKEILGIYRPWDRYLYVTDGGHWENLGLLELLRRGCTQIYCFDAAGGAPDSFKTLSEAMTLARTELGIEWGDIDLDDMRASPYDAPPSGQSAGEGKKRRGARKEQPVGLRSPRNHLAIPFEYPDTTPGVIVYCRATVTDEAPADVKAYQRANPIFPAHSTLDQFYDYEQLEAYRMLGRQVAEDAVATLRPAAQSGTRRTTSERAGQ